MSNPLDFGFSTPVATAGPRSTFSDNFNAAYDQAFKNDSFLGLEGEVQSRWEDTIRKYDARIGKPSGAPVDMRTLNEMLTPIVDPNGERGWQATFLGAGEAGEFPAAAAAARQRAQEVNAQLKALNDPSLPSLETIIAQAVKARQQVDQDVQRVDETSGFIGTLGRFAGGLAGSFTLRDPLQLGTLVAGGVGRSAIMRIGTEMLANAGAEALVVQGGINPTRRALGEPEQDVLTSAVVAGLGAGLLRGGAEGLGLLARKALGESPLPEFDRLNFEDAQLKSMFEAAPHNPDARAGLALIEGQQAFDAANPYGATEAGMKRFNGEVSEIYAAVNGKTDTAVARFIEPQPYTLDNLDFELQVVRETQPAVFAQAEITTARLQEIDSQIAELTNQLDSVTTADGVRRIDEPSADLVADYEATARDVTKPMAVREEAARQMDIIVKSLGEDVVQKEIANAGIQPKKDLQTLRQSRKAAAKQFKVARDALDAATARVKTEATIKALALGPPVPPPLGRATVDAPFHTHAQRYDVVEATARAVDDANAAIVAEPPVVTETIDGDIDLGNGTTIPKDFQFTDPANPDKTISAAAYFREMENDEAMLEAMRTCAI